MTKRKDVSNEGEVVKTNDKANELMQRLITENTRLIVEVATCDCENANECGIYVRAKEIAKILKELQNIS